MKTSLILLFLILGYTISLAQDNGYLTSNQAKPKVNLANTYSYVPPPKLILADTLEALVTYKNKEAFTSEYITLVKQATKYTFSFKAPGSTAVLLIAIVDAKVDFSEYSPFFSIKKKLIDNNNGNGFIIQLFDAKSKPFADEPIQLIGLLYKWQYYMNLIIPSNKSIIEMYESAYKKNSELKERDDYVDYLSILYVQGKEAAKDYLLSYISKKLKNDSQENNLLDATKVYSILNMNMEKQWTISKSKILEKTI